MNFLTAEWRKLAIVNYEVEPSLLNDYVPYGTELDLCNGRHYVSLIGFMFLNTRLLGVKIPWHTSFEEVNLRFYVRRFVNGEWRRGVVFIKEIVPRAAIAFVANTFYNENYEALPMQHTWLEDQEFRQVEYKWLKNKVWQSVHIKAEKEAVEIEPGSKAEFITEHYWGYAKVNKKRSNEYEVKHPGWKQYRVLDAGVRVDFAQTYGPPFGFLNNCLPDSVMLAEGSGINVEVKGVIS